MSKFHLSDKGPAPCKANVRGCPVGGEHFDSMEEAGRAFEKSMNKSHGVFSVKTKITSKKMLAIGGALLSTVSLAACNNSEVMKNANSQMGSDPTVEASVLSNAPQKNGTVQDSPTETKTNDSSIDSDKIQSKIDEYTSKAKDKAKKLEDSLSGWQKKLENTDIPAAGGGATTSNGDDSGKVLFQGKSLKVSQDELAKAQALLKSMPVAPEHKMDDYNRAEDFGSGFKSGVYAKAEHRDMPNAVFSKNSKNSRAVGGYFYDAYSGEKITIIKGSKTDNDLDHIESLKEIEESGAWAWSQEKRVEYANNLDNLAEVSYHENRSKGDGDIVDYTPSYEPVQCRYVVKQIQIKANYHLNMDSAEKAKSQEILNTKCN